MPVRLRLPAAPQDRRVSALLIATGAVAVLANTVGVLCMAMLPSPIAGGSQVILQSFLPGVETAIMWLLLGGIGYAAVRELRARAIRAKQTDESLRRYHRLAEHSFDMIVTFDPHTQRRIYVSPSVRRLYGYEPDEALALSARAIIHPDDLSRVQAALERVEQGDQTPVLYRGRRKDGTYIWVEASLTPFTDPETGRLEVVSVVRDVSERVRYQAELTIAKEQADAASRAKSEFLAIVSHELRTPLNAIIGFTDLMRQEPFGPIGNEQYRSYIADIHYSGTLLLHIINDVLEFSKAEAQRLELDERVFDFGETVRSVVRASAASFEAAQIEVNVCMADDLPWMRGDERKLGQVMFNLLSNALKFTPQGGTVTVRGESKAASGMQITVSDTGIGIAPEDLPRAFEPFVQIGSALSRRHSGTGLGLPLVKAMVEAHQGEISLASTPGEGTQVQIRIPPERTVHRRRSAA